MASISLLFVINKPVSSPNQFQELLDYWLQFETSDLFYLLAKWVSITTPSIKPSPLVIFTSPFNKSFWATSLIDHTVRSCCCSADVQHKQTPRYGIYPIRYHEMEFLKNWSQTQLISSCKYYNIGCCVSKQRDLPLLPFLNIKNVYVLHLNEKLLHIQDQFLLEYLMP
jgi:hypothetical protein